MKKAVYIKKYGEKKYEKRLEQTRDWQSLHLILVREQTKEWKRTHPVAVLAQERKRRKGGEGYEKLRHYQMNGIPHARYLIRLRHGRRWRRFKQIIAPNSVLHHEWIPETADFRGVALVEKDQHMYGFIDVIRILEGEITLFTEAEIRNRGLAI